MFKLEKLKDKAVLILYGLVGGYYIDYRAIKSALDDITNSGYTRLDVRLHTQGGSVFDGNLIYNFLSQFKGEIDMYVDGLAASMGSIIMSAGTRIHIAANGFVMIHKASGWVDGNANDFLQYAKLLNSIEKNFKEVLAKKCKKTKAEIDTWFDGTDHWFDADEAVALGICDDKFNATAPQQISKEEAVALGAKGTFDRFKALSINSTPDNMDKKAMIARYQLTGVDENSTEEQILAAIDAKIASAKNESEEAKKKSIESVVDEAITGKKIKAEQRDTYIARGMKIGIDDLKAIFQDMHAYEPVAPHIQGKTEQTPGSEDRKNWRWNDYQEKDPIALEKMPKEDPAKFKALYKAEYGVDPE